MQDNKGNPLQRTIGKAKDVNELLKTIAVSRRKRFHVTEAVTLLSSW